MIASSNNSSSRPEDHDGPTIIPHPESSQRQLATGQTESFNPSGPVSGIKSRYTAARPDPWIQMKFAIGLVRRL